MTLSDTGSAACRSKSGTPWRFATCPFIIATPSTACSFAQARCEGLTLLTADTAIAAYDVRTIDAAR